MRHRGIPRRRNTSAASLRRFARKIEVAKKGGKFSRKIKHKESGYEGIPNTQGS